MSGNLKVIKYFIKNSPVGEVQDVLDDISNIVEQDFLQTEEVKQALRDYYEHHKQQIGLQDGRVVMVSQYGRLEPIIRYSQQQTFQQEQQFNEDGEEIYQEQVQQEPQIEEIQEFVYYDPVQKIKFSFHPITLDAKVEQEQYDDQSAYNSQLIDEITQQLNSYVKRQFRNGTTTFSVHQSQQGINIEISCHNLNFKNFWGGEWLSSYQLDSQGTQISGKIQVHNHYFEQGNIQFNLSKDIAQSSVQTSKIVDFIDKVETKYQGDLEQMYSEVSEKLLKGMRRILPMTRTKFDWNRPAI